MSTIKTIIQIGTAGMLYISAFSGAGLFRPLPPLGVANKAGGAGRGLSAGAGIASSSPHLLSPVA